MKLDLRLIRSILLDVEKEAAGQEINVFNYDGYDDLTVAEHVLLLIEADYLRGEVIQRYGTLPHAYTVKGLTWQGHEFLANAKNETVWKKVLAQAEMQGKSVSMAVLNAVLTKMAQKYLGLE